MQDLGVYGPIERIDSITLRLAEHNSGLGRVLGQQQERDLLNEFACLNKIVSGRFMLEPIMSLQVSRLLGIAAMCIVTLLAMVLLAVLLDSAADNLTHSLRAMAFPASR